jgi:hypothetical protein
MLKSDDLKMHTTKTIALCLLALMSVTFLMHTASVSAARNWNLTITVDRIRLLQAVDPWPGQEHGEIYYWFRVVGVSGLFIQRSVEKETSPQSLKILTTYYRVYTHTFYGLTDRFTMGLRAEVWDDDYIPYPNTISDDYLIGYPNVGKNHRDAILVGDIKYVTIFPGQPATFEISNSKVQVRFTISWS